MALTNRTPDVQIFTPRWPDFGSLPSQQARFTYDGPSDTLFVDLYGEPRAAASIPLDRGDRDYLFLRVDPQTEEVVGLQIEHFLTYAVAQHPELRNALAVADLVGIDRAELRRLDPMQDRATEHSRLAAIEDVMLLVTTR